jgi:hypothetical protein
MTLTGKIGRENGISMKIIPALGFEDGSSLSIQVTCFALFSRRKIAPRLLNLRQEDQD